MATTLTETIKVKQLSKYGVQLENGEYVNWSKTIKESEKGKVVPGGTYDVEMYRADSGKGYINSVTTNGNVAPPLIAPVFNKTPLVKPSVVKKSEDMTRADWDAKDRRISRQGVIQAAVQAVAGMSALEDLFANAEKLAQQMLDFVNEK